MKDILFPLVGVQFLASQTDYTNPLWERLLEKWGIGFIGIYLLWQVARWSAKKDREVQTERVKREEDVRIELVKLDKLRSEREISSSQERALLLKENNELMTKQLESMQSHATRLENLTRDGIKAVTDSEAAMRMLIRKMKRPCVLPFEIPETSTDNESES